MRWFRFSCFVAVEDDAKEPDASGDIGAAIVGTVNCTVVEETIEPAEGPRVAEPVADRDECVRVGMEALGKFVAADAVCLFDNAAAVVDALIDAGFVGSGEEGVRSDGVV